jgi:hypothetical protein
MDDDREQARGEGTLMANTRTQSFDVGSECNRSEVKHRCLLLTVDLQTMAHCKEFADKVDQL